MGKEAQNQTPGPMRLDVGDVLRSRLGARASRVPGWLVRGLENLIHQDEMNRMLLEAYPRRGAEFCRAIVEHVGVDVELEGREHMPAHGDSRVLFVSNHPLGGLDGMSLIDLITRQCGREPLFVVNDLLMAIEPLRGVFLPINKHGAQSRGSVSGIDAALASDRPVVIFPAGLCSRKLKGGVADLEWKKTFVHKAREFKRDIIPLHFIGENSRSFYRWARIREMLGIKLNIEMALLPGEIFKARGKKFTVVAGEAIPWASLGPDSRAEALRIRRLVYDLKPKNANKDS